jgi:hypothetical protein
MKLFIMQFLLIYTYNYFWVLPEQSLSGPSTTEFATVIYFLMETLPAWITRFPISPWNRVAQLYPGHWVPILSPLKTRRAMVEVF